MWARPHQSFWREGRIAVDSAAAVTPRAALATLHPQAASFDQRPAAPLFVVTVVIDTLLVRCASRRVLEIYELLRLRKRPGAQVPSGGARPAAGRLSGVQVVLDHYDVAQT
jgi:hypothetical protein